MLRLLANARRSIQFDGRHLFSSFGSGRAHPSENSAGMLIGMYEDGPSPDRRDSKFFLRAHSRKNLGRGPEHLAVNSRGGEQKHRAVANRLRRKWRALGPTALIRLRARAKQPSSASFETQLLPAVTFRVSVS